MMSRYGLTDSQYECVKRIIEHDILACQSCLVESLLQFEYESFNYDNIENIYPDYSDEIKDLESEKSKLEEEKDELEDESCDLESEKEELEENKLEESEGENSLASIEDLESKIQDIEKKISDIEKRVNELDSEISAIEEQIDDLKTRQEEPNEAFEWWLVTNWLADKLRERGEIILDNDYGTWWGRGTSGQSIELDGIIHRIAKSICIE